MKIFERLVLQQLKPLVSDSLDARQTLVGMMSSSTCSTEHLERSRSTVRVVFFGFCIAFNTIQPLRLAVKLSATQGDHGLGAWIMDYLTSRPQYVRLQGSPPKNCAFTFFCSPSTSQTSIST